MKPRVTLEVDNDGAHWARIETDGWKVTMVGDSHEGALDNLAEEIRHFVASKVTAEDFLRELVRGLVVTP